MRREHDPSSASRDGIAGESGSKPLVSGQSLGTSTSMDHMLEGCQILGPDWRYRYLNAAAERHNRRPNSELLGREYREMWPGVEQTEVFARIRRTLEERIPESMENEFEFPDGTRGWFEIRCQPVPEGVLILSVDITARKQTEARLGHLHQLLGAIRHVNQLIVREKDAARLVRRSCDTLVETRSYPAVWIALGADDGAAAHVAHTGWNGAFTPFGQGLDAGRLAGTPPVRAARTSRFSIRERPARRAPSGIPRGTARRRSRLSVTPGGSSACSSSAARVARASTARSPTS